MVYRVSTAHRVATLLALLVLVTAWLVWATTSHGEWAVGVLLAYGVFAVMTVRYEMEVADGKVEVRSVLRSRSLQLKDIRQVKLYVGRGGKSIGLLTENELLYIPAYMPGLADLTGAIRTANPTVSIDARLVPRL